MQRRSFVRTVGAAGLTATGGCFLRFGEERTYSNPVFEPILADPTVTRASDGTFYAYGTEDDWGDGEGCRLVPIVRSTDLVDWEYVGEAFEERPEWKERGSIWAPSIVEHDKEYRLYYSVSEWGDENPGIGVAAASTPGGPFEDRGKLFTSDDIGVENSIDPYLFRHGGTPYLFWGSFHGIYGIELSADGMDVTGDPFQIAGDRFEAAYLYERDGYYYFFGSTGSCCGGSSSTYQVEMGRAESLEGPYQNPAGDDLLDFGGGLLIEGSDEFVGPGHNSMAIDDEGTEWLVYHAYESGNEWIDSTPRRCLLIDPLRWDGGWPMIEDRIPSVERPVPSIDG